MIAVRRPGLLVVLLVVPRGDVGADPHLPGLQHDRADRAGLGLLLLKSPMQFALRRVEEERRQAPAFGRILSISAAKYSRSAFSLIAWSTSADRSSMVPMCPSM